MLLYDLFGNLPFILIQRYNRPRLVILLERQRELQAMQAAKRAARATVLNVQRNKRVPEIGRRCLRRQTLFADTVATANAYLGAFPYALRRANCYTADACRATGEEAGQPGRQAGDMVEG